MSIARASTDADLKALAETAAQAWQQWDKKDPENLVAILMPLCGFDTRTALFAAVMLVTYAMGKIPTLVISRVGADDGPDSSGAVTLEEEIERR